MNPETFGYTPQDDPSDRRGVNRGPYGGTSYDNDANYLAQSGETWPAEARDATADVMEYMPVVGEPYRGTYAQATANDMEGGNQNWQGGGDNPSDD